MEQNGYDVIIYSKRRKSEMFGAQYMHAPIPGVQLRDPVEVSYRLEGTIDGYRQKVYGLQDDIEVSPDTLAERHWAWDIRDCYNKLWEVWVRRIVDVDLESEVVRAMAIVADTIPVISTVPRSLTCERKEDHKFQSESIWAAGEAHERGLFLGESLSAPINTVLCSGNWEDPWYRISNVFGVLTAEWPRSASTAASEHNATLVHKPIDTDCDCYPSLFRAGRYGRWEKGVLVHDAYEGVLNAFAP